MKEMEKNENNVRLAQHLQRNKRETHSTKAIFWPLYFFFLGRSYIYSQIYISLLTVCLTNTQSEKIKYNIPAQKLEVLKLPHS